MTRALHDTVSEDYTSVDSCLSPSATIVMMPEFEYGIVKIQQNRCLELYSDGKKSVERLVLVPTQENGKERRSLSIVERASKRVRRCAESSNVSYMDKRFFLPTSNICELLFSIAGHAL